MYTDISQYTMHSSDRTIQSAISSYSSQGPINSPTFNNLWKSSWFNNRGQWYNFTGNIFQTTDGKFDISVGSLKFGVLRFTNKGFHVINTRVDILRVDYQMSNNSNIYSTAGSAIGYFGFDYKEGIGVYAKISALSLGGNVGPVGGRIDIGSIGFVFAFKSGKLEIGAAIGIGYTVSVDIIWIIEFLDDSFGG
jgi:hypothetical protein